MTKKNEVQTSFEDHPDQAPMWKAARSVNAIAHMNAEIRDLQNQLVHEVSVARENGASWRAIGDALHVSRSAAQKYYGELIATV